MGSLFFVETEASLTIFDSRLGAALVYAGRVATATKISRRLVTAYSESLVAVVDDHIQGSYDKTMLSKWVALGGLSMLVVFSPPMFADSLGRRRETPCAKPSFHGGYVAASQVQYHADQSATA